MLHGSMRVVSIAAWLVAQASGPVANGAIVLAIDEANSQILIQVGKAGLFGFAGHAHEVKATGVRGRVTFDAADLQRASVYLEVPTGALRVSETHESPADLGEVQRVMLGEQVLDVKRFPTIVVRSRRIGVTARTAVTAELLIEADVTLHGTTRRMPIRASASLDVDGRLTARGSFTLKQTEFGMVPVTAVGGTIRVKDELDIQFVLKASPPNDARIAW